MPKLLLSHGSVLEACKKKMPHKLQQKKCCSAKTKTALKLNAINVFVSLLYMYTL